MSYCGGTPQRRAYYYCPETGEMANFRPYLAPGKGPEWKTVHEDPPIPGCGHRITEHWVEEDDPMFQRSYFFRFCPHCDTGGPDFPPPPGGAALC